MRLSFLKYIYYVWVAAWAFTVMSCTDESFFEDGSGARDSGSIGFSALTALPYEVATTRSDGEKELYDPLVLNCESGEFPLYLHTYEHTLDDDRCGTAIDGAQQTRGLQVNTPDSFYIVHKSFGVYAEEDETRIPYFALQSTKLTALGNTKFWTTNQTQRWPGQERLNFGAVAPWEHQSELKDLNFNFTDNEKKKVTFKYTARKSGNNRDAESQVDVMVASSSFTREETADYSYRVPLHFNHALSAIKFAVRDVLKGEVVSIKIKGVYGTGDCEYSTSDIPGFRGSFTWSRHSEKTEYTQLFNHRIEDGNFNPDDERQDVLLNRKMPEKTFMLIPQQIPDDAVIEIVIKRDNVVPSLPETITVKGKIKDNLVTEWKPGHEYIYTISTSRDNWVYVFDVTGNEAKGYNNIYVYSPNDDEFSDSQNTGYYSVTSYRYRANNQSYKELLPWTATFNGSDSYEVKSVGDALYEGKYITPEKWIADKKWVSDGDEEHKLYSVEGDEDKGEFRGKGSIKAERRDLDFYPHYLVTDWGGDKKMQNAAPYEYDADKPYDKDNPYDLSTFGSKNTATDRSTANCYIVDRGGWYCLPLVYGNGIVKGQTNESAYKANASGERILPWFKNYDDKDIKAPGITGAKSADLVWEDAYNMVRDVELAEVGDNKETMVRFFVDSDNLQQGNAIVAVKDGNGIIMWSWHIWATEHWLGSDGKPHQLSSESGEFVSTVNATTGVRERGDAQVKVNMATGYSYYMSPYNLGWCDPKSVVYLKRKSRMDFVQYMPDKTTETKLTGTLDVIQQGVTVNYKIGNNTYYQWGRKDPLVGFVDRQKNYKANFGVMEFGLESQNGKKLKDGIRNPHIMYAGVGTGKGDDPDQDWTVDRYWNLWNNSSTVNIGSGSAGGSKWEHVKTVYDPCPVGYVVPNAGVWHVVGGTDKLGGGSLTYATFATKLNGERDRMLENSGIYIYHIWGTSDKSLDNTIYLVPTGNRWYSDSHSFKQEEFEAGQETEVKAGRNYNLRMFYAWSSRWSSEYAAYSGAVGIDAATQYNYYVAPEFVGRRAMGRPVRPIRDPNYK